MEKFVREKIDEYLDLLVETGQVQVGSNIYRKMKDSLYSLKIERIYDAPGDAVVDGDTLKICFENINRQCMLLGLGYVDEVLFHEFSHVVNSFHSAIYGKDSFNIDTALKMRMKYSSISSFQDNKLLYNQDPYLGVILLDEFIAQNMAQKLVIYKYNKMENKQQDTYMTFDGLMKYTSKDFVSTICEPKMRMKTSFSCYEEFDSLARAFIKKNGFGVDEFVRLSVNYDLPRTIISNLDNKTATAMYTDLCYLGVIKEKIYSDRGFTRLTPGDPATNPRMVRQCMEKILVY